MINSHDPPRTVRGDLELLSHDLASAHGTLSEITTVWRRAHQDWPELPLRLPLQLQDATRQLAVSAQALTRESGIGAWDAALWDHLGEPLRRAGDRLLLLIVQLARIRDWSLSGPGGELSEPDQAVLVIQFG